MKFDFKDSMVKKFFIVDLKIGLIVIRETESFVDIAIVENICISINRKIRFPGRMLLQL